MICGVCGAARNTRIIRLQNLREATAATRHNGTAVLSQFFALAVSQAMERLCL